MRMKWKVVPAALGLAAWLPAQDQPAKEVHLDVVAQAGAGVAAPAVAGIAPQAATFEFIAAEKANLFGKPVVGAPYSAEGFSEVVQSLADGTRITRKHSQKMWRDSKGRTREENTLPALGPWASQGDAPRFVTITDPVAKVIYTLNDRDKTATRRKMPDLDAMMAGMREGKSGAVVVQSREHHQVVVRDGSGAPSSPAGQVRDVTVAAPAMPATPGVMMRTMHMISGGVGGKEESLGTQTMEGLKVEGKRQTHTIAAGEIGNDRALTTVMERWTSPELQVTVRTLTKDPQMGESTYRLTNISRAEPAAALFQVPADYMVKEAEQIIRFDRVERK